jgi:beta-phosphoglucomutase family hydrolase
MGAPHVSHRASGAKTPARPTAEIGPERFDAVLFDLDGVLTDTARLHAACWKRVFDELLERLARDRGEPFRPFEIEADYGPYVDGKARLDGVRDFLASRGVRLPEGTEESPVGEDSVRGMARRKNELFGCALASEGVEVYESSLDWLRRLRSSGLRTAVVSASHHCAEILRAAGIDRLFDVRVDGQVADRLALAGKPAPDTFLEAARRLGVAPRRAVVVEDALSGVRAGRAGGFGLVIGVARRGNQQDLMAAGADVVVNDLGEMMP